MKKFLLFILSVCIAALTAHSQAFAADAAFVINGQGGYCGFLDGNGHVAVSTDVQIVATQSNNSNAEMKCQAKVPNDTGTAVHYSSAKNGGACFMTIMTDGYPISVYSYDYYETVSSNGDATLLCFYP